ncbi:MAG TPA: rubrerythrin family protein [Armatimonadetes bacterium]|nr:rubrerythrin family protein [Armatimonadota bacterium]
MREMTKENLQAAFAGESQAHMKYLVFSQKAEDEGLANVARLFRALAFAEQVHATNHLKTLGQLGNTAQNLDAAMGGETFEVEEMYPAYIEVAKAQGESEAQRSMERAMEAEKVHASLYRRAKEAVSQGRDAEIGPIYICEKCGWTVEGEPPETCPLCGAPKERFKEF